jgi:hypothetical protein
MIVFPQPRQKWSVFGGSTVAVHDVKTTLQLYAHSVSEDRMTAQGTMLQAILGAGTVESGLRAD